MLKKLNNIEGKKVLDFGCGEGWLSEILLRKGAQVWSFDISAEAVKNVKSMFLKKYGSGCHFNIIQAAAEDLGFKSNAFDYIIGNAILHHLDLQASAQEVHRVLKKGGIAYFTEPLGHNPMLNWYRKKTPHLRSSDEKPLLFNDFRIYKKLFSGFSQARDILFKLDNLILRLFPLLRRYCWYSILIMEK